MENDIVKEIRKEITILEKEIHFHKKRIAELESELK